jgi:hypothetical protein
MMAPLQRNRGEKRAEVNSGSCGIIMASTPSEDIQLSKEVRARAGTTTETENYRKDGIAEPNSYLLWLEDEYRKNKSNLERMPLSPRKVYYNRTSSAEALPSTVRMTRRGAIVPSSPRSVSFSFSDSQIYISLCSFQSRQYAR